MKLLFILTIAISLGSLSASSPDAQEIFWEPNEQRDSAVLDTDADIKPAPATTTRAASASEIYDSRDDDTPAADTSEDEAAEPAVRAPRQATPSAVRQRSQDTAPAQPQTRRRGAQDQATSKDAQQKPAAKQSDKKRGAAPAPASIEAPDKTETPKALPGEVDVKPAEPKTKLQWGR